VYGRYVPKLPALANIELNETAPYVLSRKQIFTGFADVGQATRQIALNCRFPTHAMGASLCASVKVVNVCNLFNGASFKALFSVRRAFRIAAGTSCSPPLFGFHGHPARLAIGIP
jgi:hypothetical protein